MAAAATSASLCLPANGNRARFRIGPSASHLKRPRMLTVRSDLDANVSDMSVNGKSYSIRLPITCTAIGKRKDLLV